MGSPLTPALLINRPGPFKKGSAVLLIFQSEAKYAFQLTQCTYNLVQEDFSLIIFNDFGNKSISDI
jgi:hypothetical protein